jgi:hypothetical protein
VNKSSKIQADSVSTCAFGSDEYVLIKSNWPESDKDTCKTYVKNIKLRGMKCAIHICGHDAAATPP